MNLKYGFRLLVVTLLSVGSLAAIASADMDSFFEDPESLTAFDRAVSTGVLDQARQHIVDQCAVAGAEKGMDCECLSEGLGSLPDKVLFYESIQAYNTYNEVVAAMQADDMARVEELKAAQANRESVVNDLEKQCTVK